MLIGSISGIFLAELRNGRCGCSRESPPPTWSKQECLLLSAEIDLEQVRRFVDQSAGKLLVDRSPTNRKCRTFALESAHKTVENYRVYALPNRRSSRSRQYSAKLKDIPNHEFIRLLSEIDFDLIVHKNIWYWNWKTVEKNTFYNWI